MLLNDTNGSFFDAFVHDRATGETRHVSVSDSGEQGTSSAVQPAITADGRYVVFSSPSTNLVPGDTNGQSDIFIVGGVPPDLSTPQRGRRAHRILGRRSAAACDGLAGGTSPRSRSPRGTWIAAGRNRKFSAIGSPHDS